MYPLLIPQDVSLPAIAYQTISDVPGYAHGGATGLDYARIQITCQASTYTAVKSLQAAVRRAVSRFTGDGETVVQGPRIENQRDDHADVFGTSVARLDLVCFYRNAEGV